MRKTAAILLLFILLFNWVGYRFVFYYLQNTLSSQLETKLDQGDYDPSQLIEIKVPLNMPYQSNRSEFERHDGEIKIDGILYKYVKRKVHNNQLVLLCLPHEKKMKVEAAKDHFFKMVNDLQPANSKKSAEKGENFSLKVSLADYVLTFNNWNVGPWTNQTTTYFDYYSLQMQLQHKKAIEKPPNYTA